MISIVIPVYNAQDTIRSCLESIFASQIDISYEVIVVDDASRDRTPDIVKEFPCRYFRMEKRGVAAARNYGIRETKGEIIFFFDADVRIKQDTISKFLKHFQEDADTYIIQGRWDKRSPIPGFLSSFLLLKYTYNLKKLFGNKKRIEVANLETGCLAVRREVFENLGIFNEAYSFSGGEEHELGMRFLKTYKIYYYSDIFVEHRFGSIFASLGKIYRRTINFSMLSFQAENKNFMRLHKNSVPVQDKISVVIIFFMFCVLLMGIFNPKVSALILAYLGILYFLNMIGFVFYMGSEKSALFALAGIFADFLIMIPRLLGILRASWIFYVLRDREFKI